MSRKAIQWSAWCSRAMDLGTRHRADQHGSAILCERDAAAIEHTIQTVALLSFANPASVIGRLTTNELRAGPSIAMFDAWVSRILRPGDEGQPRFRVDRDIADSFTLRRGRIRRNSCGLIACEEMQTMPVFRLPRWSRKAARNAWNISRGKTSPVRCSVRDERRNMLR